MLKKWNRVGSMIIDFLIAGMFFQLVTSVIFSVIPVSVVSITRENLLIDLLLIWVWIVYIVSVYALYNILCFKFFKVTFGKFILRVRVIDATSNIQLFQPDMDQIVRREFFKWTYAFASLGIYALYCAGKVMFARVVDDILLPHDQVSGTRVIVV